ncbi:MAG: glycosyltransferase family 39 protein [Patescibacteria group bacterium]
MRKLLAWLDEHLLFSVTGFLLAFIPLFPKLPLFDILPGYIVRVRLEDFFIAAALLLWLVQLWRKKVSFGPNPLAKPILAYLTVGILSMLSAVFISQTVPMESLHIGKMLLHFLRRVEYFSLFFVFFSAVKNMQQVKIYLTILVTTIVGVTLYGYGQKYLYWPAFSTMNREFSKGWALYLTQHARVLSTFGGHYDLAAFTMGMLIVLWALFFSVQKRWLKTLIFIILGGAFWLLILTASRTSFLAYIGGVSVLFALWAFREGIAWSATRWLGVVVISIVVMLTFGDLSDRFLKILKLEQRVSGIRALVLRPFGKPPSGGDLTFLENNENNIEAVTSKSDFPPLPIKPTDVTYEGPDGFISTTSASGTAIIKEVPRTYSQAALVYDLSTGIRLDALWPRAIKGFLRNPLLGSGYSTLTKTQQTEFTEAESTDNDFLRTLGETGILGFLTFGWILGSILVVIWKSFTRIKDKVFVGLLMSLGSIVIALLINAVYIDIFEASKVALSFWALVGVVLGGVKVAKFEEIRPVIIPDIKETAEWLGQKVQRILTSSQTYVILLLLFSFVLRYYKIHVPLADWHSWRQADTSAVTRNYVRYGIDPLYPRFDDLSSVASGKPNPNGYRFVEFPVYNIASVIVDKLFPGYSVEYSGRLTSIFMSLGTLIFIYLIVKKYLGVRIAWLAGFFFAVIPYNIYWSRVILPEPTLVFLTTGMIFFFDKWVESEKIKYWIPALLFGVLALLVKFTAVFFAIPMAYLIFKKWGRKAFFNPWIYAYALITVIPFFLWRLHISQYPEGIPAYLWLFNGNNIRFKGAWFWWLFAERISKMILGGWGVGLFILGIIRNMELGKNKSSWIFHFWLLGMLLYLIVFATGNVQHDYYQIILIPIICIFIARGADLLISGIRESIHPWLGRIMFGVLVFFMLSFGWYQARDLYNINHPEIVEVGREFDRLVPNAQVKVIAPYNGDTAFLYQTGKRGWPIIEESVDALIEKGAQFYISTNFDEVTRQLINVAQNVIAGTDSLHPYKIIKQTDNYVIIQLVPDKLLPQ